MTKTVNAAGSGGSAGLGIGGVYFASGGTVCLDASTVAAITGNTASTSNNEEPRQGLPESESPPHILHFSVKLRSP